MTIIYLLAAQLAKYIMILPKRKLYQIRENLLKQKNPTRKHFPSIQFSLPLQCPSLKQYLLSLKTCFPRHLPRTACVYNNNLDRQVYWMTQETQILQLTGLSNEEIARKVLDILNQSRIGRFTILLRRTPLKPDSSNKPGSLLKLQGLNISTQKSYRTSHFASLHRSSSVSNNESITSSCQTLSPVGMALRMYALGQYGQALAMLNTLKQEGETGKEVLIGIANCKFHLAHYEAAVSLYRSILTQHLSQQEKTSPEAAQLYNNLGSAYARLNLQKPSMNAFSQAIEIYHMHPQMDCSPLYSNIAGIYLKAGMPEAAEGYYLKALAERKAKRPSQRELLLHCYRRLAQAQAQMKKYSDAESHLAKASKLAQIIGGLEGTLKEEADLREQQGKWQQAIDFYERLHALHEEQDEDENENERKGELYENASRIYKCMGKGAEHRKYLDKAVKEYRISGNLAKQNELQNLGRLQVLTQSTKGNR